MALDDVVGTGAAPDFDPRSAIDDLIRRSVDSSAPAGPMAPDILANRLYRKLNQPKPAEAAPAPAEDDDDDKKKPDFSSKGIPLGKLPDFSSQGTPLDAMPPPAAPAVALGATGQAKAALKGIPHGAIEGAGGVLKGLGVAAARQDSASPAVAEAAAGMDPANNWPLPGAPTDREAVPPRVPVQQHPLYRAGQAVQGSADTLAPMSDQEKASIGGRVGTGIGSVAPYVAAGAINPGLGVIAGAGGMAASSAGDTFDAAIKKGATEEDAAKAAGYAALVGGGLGAVPLGMVLKPIRIASPLFTGTAAGYLEEAVKSGLTFATVGEAQEYLVQKIAKDFYDPEAGYSPDAKRVIASLITGGALGAGGHFMERRAARIKGEAPPAATPDDTGAPPAPAGLPGPDTGSAAPGSSGPTPGGGPPPPTGDSGGSSGGRGPDFKMDAGTRAKMDRIYRYFNPGKDPSDMADHDLFNAVNDHLRDTSKTGFTAKSADEDANGNAQAEPQASGKQSSSTEQTERDGLKRYGWEDAEIDAMSPAQRRREFQTAMETGQSEKPAEQPTSESDVGAKSAGTRDEPIRPQTAEDVVKAQPVEPKSPAQAAAENYQHAHVELPQLGLEGSRSISIETGVGQERKGIDGDGKPWSVRLDHAAYGRIKGSKGADGQPLDIFVGPHPTSPHVFVIDQHHPEGGFDEHKIMAGFRTPIDAMHAYAHSYNDHGENRIGHVTAMSPDDFKAWMAGDTTKPLRKEPTPSASTAEAGSPSSPSFTEATVSSPDAPKETPTGRGGVAGGSASTTPNKGGRSKEPLSLLQFIASKGGVEPHPELKALDLAGDHRVQLPDRKGFFGVTRPTGMPLDLMREAAEEAGYLKGEHNKTSTIRNFLDAIDNELRGQKHHAEGEEGHRNKRERKLDAEGSSAARDKAIAAARDDIAAEYKDLPEDLLDQAATIMADERLDLDSAVEAAAIRTIAEDPDYDISHSDIADAFGEGAIDEIQPRRSPGDGEHAALEGGQEHGPDEGKEAGAHGKRVPTAGAKGREGEEQGRARSVADLTDRESFIYDAVRQSPTTGGVAERVQKAVNDGASNEELIKALTGDGSFGGRSIDRGTVEHRGRALTIVGPFGRVELKGKELADAIRRAFPKTEPTPAGKQTVLPGAEPISQGEHAQRKTDEALKPKVAQKPADDGLFGDERNQTDLLDNLPKATGIAVELGGPALQTFRRVMESGQPKEVATLLKRADEEFTKTEDRGILDRAKRVVRALMHGKSGYTDLESSLTQLRGTLDYIDREPQRIIDDMLGDDADKVSLVDIQRAAELLANNPGMEPATAFGQAVVKNAVEQGFITEAEAVKAYGEEVKDILGSGREGAPGSGAPADQGGTAPLEVGAGGAKEAGELSRRSKGNGSGDTEAAATEAGAAAGRDGTTSGREAAGDQAVDTAENSTSTKDAGSVSSAAEEPSDGVPQPVSKSDARAGAEDVQPTESGGQVGGVRQREGDRSEPDVRGTDEGRASGEGRLSEGAAGERSAGSRDGGDAGLSEPRADDAASRREKRATERAANLVEGENFVIEPGALDEDRGPKAKARDNLKAIETLQAIEAEGRPATAEEQQLLSRYVGWGGIKNMFPDAQGKLSPEFELLGDRLRALLSPEEYETARRSIQYAHYTSETIVRAMWKAVGKMGFAEGQVFEPGMGVGNFAGMMPPDIAAQAHYAGVELDHVTARIAKLLYPKFGVRQGDFTKISLPENGVDLAIGNPPFADIAIKSDPKYKQDFLLHDYFFAKSIDGVRPGGLLSFVTSAGTMNKGDAGAREYIADRADFVGGIRLPGNAFEKNAGTQVTTDILFFRKRLPSEAAVDRTWTETVDRTLPNKNGMKIVGAVSRYFSEHPEMVLGEEGFFDKLYQNRYAVQARPGEDFKANLDAAIERLPADVMSPWQSVNESATEHDFTNTEKKEGTYYIGPNGQLHQVNSGAGTPVRQRGKGVENGRTAADMERIKGLIPIRDSLRAVYAADLEGNTEDADKARTALNKHYDAFVEQFGPINKAVIQTRRPSIIQQESERQAAREEARYAGTRFREGTFDDRRLIEAGASLSVIARERQAARELAKSAGATFDEGDFDVEEIPDNIIDKRPNVDPFMDDPESYRLRAIERYNEGTGTGHKSPVFFENIITREQKPKISSVNDALLYSLSKFGRVNIPEMATLAKKSESEVIEDLGNKVFRVPGTQDAFETDDAYLSGNVRKKLALAKKAAERNPAFKRNVAALEAAQPIPLAPTQIHAQLGMPWIPAADVGKFGTEEMGLEKLHVRYFSALGQWVVNGDTDSVSAMTTWGTPDRRAPALIQDALNRQNPKIYDKVMVDGRENSVLNVAKTEAAQDKVKAIKEKFADWIWADQDRSDRLAAFYNENYNNLVVREYNGDYLTTPGISSTWSWRPHQKRVIARIIQSGNTYVAHAVGAGKTSEYIGAIMEKRRLGLARKPMVAVPNHMLAQFTKEWYEQYPTARLAIADEKRFHTDRRKQFIANVAMEDLDAIIVTHSAFGMIPMSDDFQNGMVSEEISQYRELLAQASGPDNRITRSRIEKQIERLEQRLIGRANKRRDQVFTFEEMGVDDLTVDEAHLFRKLDFATQMTALKGVSPEGSGMAWDLYTKAQYLEKIKPGRGLTLGSGTPITNTMAELYTLSRFMQPGVLAERGLEKFDAWAGAFGESVSELEQDAAGNYKPVSRFAKFVNVAELSAMVRQVMDVVTSRQLEQYVTRPKIAGGKREMHLAEKSPALTRFQDMLAERMKKIHARKGPPQKGDDIMLTVINDGRHAAIDMRLAGGEQSRSVPSKLDLLVDNVFRIHQETKRQKFFNPAEDGGYEAKPKFTGPATQLVFINLGLSGNRGFSVPEYIRSELVRRGVPKSEVAYIYDFKSATAKQRLFNDMNEGKVRILMGSVAKMGVGTNVQRRLAAIHNMDPLWYPADDEQRNGRGVRQGNMNPEIGIHDYSTKGTYDSTMWGMMEKKARFIQGFFEGDPSLRDMDDLGEASQYEQAKALTTNDPRLIKLTELKQELERAQRRKSQFESDVYQMRNRRANAGSSIEHYAERIADTKKDIAQRVDISGDNFKATIGKTGYDVRADYGDALFERLDELTKNGVANRAVKIGDIGGFPLMAEVHKSLNLKDESRTEVWLQMNGKDRQRDVNYGLSSRGTVQSIESVLRGLEDDLTGYELAKAKAQKFFDESADKAKEKFKGDEALNELARQVRQMQSDMASTPAAEKPAEPESAALDRAALIASRLTPEQRASVERLVREAIQKMLGNHVTVEILDKLIGLSESSRAKWGDLAKDENVGARGMYRPWRRLIQLALTNDLTSSAAHEAYHAIEYQLQTPQERKLMQQETPRLREKVGKSHPGWTKGEVDGMADEEIRATAFEDYAEDRSKGGAGIHIGVKSWWSKLLDVLRRIANGLRGMGFKTADDIFGKAYEGGYADAKGDKPRFDAIPPEGWTPEPSMAALFRRKADTMVNAHIKDLMETTASNKFVERYQNLSEPVKRLQEAVEAVEGGTLPDSQAFYVKKRLFPGKMGAEVQDFNKAHLDPLIKLGKDNDLSLGEMGDIMYALHAPERNAAMEEINHPALDGSDKDVIGRRSGMSDKEAADILAKYSPKVVAEIDHRLNAIRDFNMDMLVSSGLESQATVNGYRAKYKHYVPLSGWDVAPEDQPEKFAGSGNFNVRGPETKRAFGRKSKAQNPLINVLEQSYRTIERAKKNEYLRSLNTALGAIEEVELNGFVRFDQGKPKKTIDPMTGLVRNIEDPLYRNEPGAVGYKIGGNQRYMIFESQELGEAIKRMHPDGLGMFQPLLDIQNKLKALWTHYSPDFLARHFLFRYPIEGTLNSFEQKESGNHAVSTYVRNAIPFLGRASRAIFAHNKGVVSGDAETAQMQSYWQEMRKAGGSMTFRSMRDTDVLREHLEHKLKSLNTSALQSVKDKHQAAVEAMDTVTNALDNSLRLAAYSSARKQGKTPEQAALIARDATVDFQLAGKWKNAIGLWFPFGNIAIQTGIRMTAAVGRSRIMRRVFMGTMMAGFMAGAFNYLIGGDDKDGVPFMDKIPDWDRHLNFIVMNPFHHDDKGRPVPIKIPMPYNWAFPYVIGSAMATMVFGHDKHRFRKMLGLVTRAGVEVATPFGQEDNYAAMLAPELTRPFIHAYTNRNWNGAPVHADQAFQKGPNAESGRKSTGDGWKYIASGMNDVSGGDKRHSGALDFYPEDLRLMFDYVGGSQRRLLENIYTTGHSAAKGESPDLTHVPLARVIMGNDYDAADRSRRYERSDQERHPWKR